MLDLGFPKEVMCVLGPVFSSVEECGISSDVMRYKNVMENVTDSRHFWEACNRSEGLKKSHGKRRQELGGTFAPILEEGENGRRFDTEE